MSDHLLNTRFGPYQPEEIIGAGSITEVYRAIDTRTGKSIALKVLQNRHMGDDDTVKLFVQEARVAAGLRHPHILPILSHGIIGGRPYLVMDYMAEGSLGKWLASPRTLRLDEASRFLKQISDSLDYAHTQRAAHYGLKPNNVLFKDSQHLLVADFSVARPLLVDSTDHVLAVENLLYMSPELIDQEKAGYPSDIYSLTVMAYVLLTGYYPFYSRDPVTLLQHQLRQFAPNPSEVNPDLPAAFDKVLLKGLAKNPKNRYKTVETLVQMLAGVMESETAESLVVEINLQAQDVVDRQHLHQKKVQAKIWQKRLVLAISLILTVLIPVLIFLALQNAS